MLNPDPLARCNPAATSPFAAKFVTSLPFDCGAMFRCEYYAASDTRNVSAIQRSLSDNARSLIACFFATVFSLPRSRVPSGFFVGAEASGGNNPKLIFIGWNERGPASMVSIWPPVM